MREVDMSSPSLGWDADTDPSGNGLDLDGLEPSTSELGALLDVLSELPADEPDLGEPGLDDAQVSAITDWVGSLDGDDLARLEADGSAMTGAWMDSLDDGQFFAAQDEARRFAAPGQFGDYMTHLARVSRTLDGMNGREAIRLAQDRDEAARRAGPRYRRPSTEDKLASAALRLSGATYLPGQVDLAGDPWTAGEGFADGQFGPVVAPEDVRRELAYQIGGGLPPARQRREPLPGVGRLARRIGLVR